MATRNSSAGRSQTASNVQLRKRPDSFLRMKGLWMTMAAALAIAVMAGVTLDFLGEAGASVIVSD